LTRPDVAIDRRCLELIVGQSPFVMKSTAELRQAFKDYQLGHMGELNSLSGRILIAFNFNSEDNMPRMTNTRQRQDTKRALGPLEIVNAILENPQDIEKVRWLTSKDVSYVSLNYSNPDLKKNHALVRNILWPPKHR
jgi:hypothetical protein